ncbi:heme-binding protein [Mycolicibacterium sp. S2-37]|uniref:SOUL family heme-binding protein n=1 Tax=Mycolicibacterium sp. S2-37 TaxID=2810297 RepID=UPI001A944FAE|nr:heme-binding protein [Mycolicibacterium sp. S2-37]MBO0676506.1 heme-binding protein [Mycolicibacterium sp. S2-37]
MTPLATIAKIPGQALEVLGSIAGVRWGTEEPRHTVVAQLGVVEIRRYGPRIAAETSVDADEDEARNIGFRRLAHYIFGGNLARAEIAMTAPVAQNQKIAMTAPVAQTADGGESVIRFYMPAEFTLDTLPEPDNDRVVLVPVPSETVAVLRYTGDRSPAAVQQKREKLYKALEGSEYTTVGEPFSWFYDPPFTLPFRRRNEIGVRVSG